MLKIAGLPIEIVILRCPFMNMDNPLTRELFIKMMHLKYKGYGNRHLAGTLPLDATDYVADHPLVCIRDERLGLIPITGSKVISYETCKFFNLDFALESCFKKGNNTVHLETLYKIINDSQDNNNKIAYHGGYTIDPHLVKTDEERAIVRELFIASTTLYFKENNITELLGFGVPKFKTEQFFYHWGYERCSVQGTQLDSFPVYFLPGNDGILMHLKEFSNSVLDISDKYRFIWKDKTDLGNIAPIKEKIRAA
jgi:hypothetical protein